MRQQLLTALLITFCLLACKTQQKTENTRAESNTGCCFKKVIVDKELYAATTEVIPIDTTYILSDTIHIVTKAVTACNPENFKLMWNGAMAKSLPPQTSLKLLLQGDGTCQSKRKFNLSFNLSPMRYKGHDSTAVQTIIVRVSGATQTLKYNY